MTQRRVLTVSACCQTSCFEVRLSSWCIRKIKFAVLILALYGCYFCYKFKKMHFSIPDTLEVKDNNGSSYIVSLFNFSTFFFCLLYIWNTKTNFIIHFFYILFRQFIPSIIYKHMLLSMIPKKYASLLSVGEWKLQGNYKFQFIHVLRKVKTSVKKRKFWRIRFLGQVLSHLIIIQFITTLF